MVADDVSSAQRVFRQFMHAYLVERDAEKVLTFAAEDICGIGTGRFEIARNKNEFKKLIETEILNDPRPFEITYHEITAKVTGADAADIFAVFEVYRKLPDGDILSIDIRQTAFLRRICGKYKISSVHVSAASDIQEEGEFYPFRFGEKTLSELKKKLQAKTFELLNNSISGGMMGGYLEPDFPLYFINGRMLERLGFTYEEFVQDTGGYIINCIHPDDREQVSLVVSKSDDYEVKYRMRRKDGSYIWVLGKGKKVIAENGREAIISVCTDITSSVLLEQELKQKAESLAAKNYELEALTSHIPGGVCKLKTDENFTILYGNDFFFSIHGYTREQLKTELHNEAIRYIYPDDRARVIESIQSALNNKRNNFEFEVRIIKRDTSVMWELVRGSFMSYTGYSIMDCVVLDITERKAIEQELQLSEERFRIALSKSSNVIFDYNIKSGISVHSSRAAKLYNLPEIIPGIPEYLIKKKIIHRDYIDTFAQMCRRIRDGIPEISCLIKTKQASGVYVWSNISVTSIFDSLGKPVRAIGLIEDVTRQKEAEYACIKEEQYRAAMLSDAVIYYEVNITWDKIEKTAGEQFFEYNDIMRLSYDELVKKVMLEKIHEDDREKCCRIFERKNVLDAFAHGRMELLFEHRRLNSAGRMIWMLTTMHLIKDFLTSDVRALIYVKDIDNQKRKELTLEYKSQHDSLTGLYNRETTEKMIGNILRNSTGAQMHAFLIIDVDHFKSINDTYGHQFGDRILSCAAEKMKEVFSQDAVIGRIGGDEFVVFAKNITDRASLDHTIQMMRNLLRNLFSGEEPRVPISCSIGISVSERGSRSFDELYRNADTALYAAKNGGKDRYIYYKTEQVSFL